MNKRPETTFFVAPYGTDTWSGQLPDPNSTDTDGPFATFQRAQRAVHEFKAGSPGPVTVLARGGTYYPGSPIVFTPEDSGTTDRPVTYAAYPGEKPVLSGGVRLALDWQPYKDGIMKADLSHIPTFQSKTKDQKSRIHFDQLFVNGRRKHRA